MLTKPAVIRFGLKCLPIQIHYKVLAKSFNTFQSSTPNVHLMTSNMGNTLFQ